MRVSLCKWFTTCWNIALDKAGISSWPAFLSTFPPAAVNLYPEENGWTWWSHVACRLGSWTWKWVTYAVFWNIHLDIQGYMFVYMHIHVDIHVCIYVHASIHLSIHIICIYVYNCKYIYIHDIYIYIYIDIHIHNIYIYTYIYIYIHDIYIYVYMYICTV